MFRADTSKVPIEESSMELSRFVYLGAIIDRGLEVHRGTGWTGRGHMQLGRIKTKVGGAEMEEEGETETTRLPDYQSRNSTMHCICHRIFLANHNSGAEGRVMPVAVQLHS